MSRPKGSKNKPKETMSSFTNEELSSYKEVLKEKSVDININTNDILSSKPHKEIKPVCQCERCGKNIYDSAVSLNLTYLSGVAWWHRTCPDRLKICRDCAHELSDIIDNWAATV